MMLIDGDAIVYIAGFASETSEVVPVVAKNATLAEYKRQDPMPAAFVEPIVDRIIDSLAKKLKHPDYKIFLTDSDIRNNHRYKLFPEYKQSRTKVSKPLHYNNIRNFLVAKYSAIVVSGIEADDAIGEEQGDDTIIVSHDKDMFMIPGHHYSMTYKKSFFVSDPGSLLLYRDISDRPKIVGTGFKWFCAQMLLGDKVDNIKGLYRWGPVKIFNLLNPIKDSKDCWAAVCSTYKDQLKPVDYRERLEVSSKLLWIRRKQCSTVDDYIGSL